MGLRAALIESLNGLDSDCCHGWAVRRTAWGRSHCPASAGWWREALSLWPPRRGAGKTPAPTLAAVTTRRSRAGSTLSDPGGSPGISMQIAPNTPSCHRGALRPRPFFADRDEDEEEERTHRPGDEVTALRQNGDGWTRARILDVNDDDGTYVVSMPSQSNSDFLRTYVLNRVRPDRLRPLSLDRRPTEGDPVLIRKWNGEGYYEWLDATVYSVRHSLTFDVLLDGYDGDVIEAVNEDRLRSSSMGWYDEDDGDSGDYHDQAGGNDRDSGDSQFADGNYWGSEDSYAVDDRDAFDDSGDDGGLFSHGDGDDEDYDDFY